MMDFELPRASRRWPMLVFACVFCVLTPAFVRAQTDSRAAPGVGADTSVRGPRAVLSAPGADTIAQIRSVGILEVIEDHGDWVRVRLEGWVARVDDGTIAPEAAASLHLSALRADPERYVGAPVRWRVQHIAVQRADSLRSDMPRGAPYLLARDPGGEAGLVYAIVPDHLLSVVSNLAPLQRVEIVGRILLGRSPLTGHPILELLEVRP